MGRKKGKRWNSCLIWFLMSLGAFCVLSSSIDATSETSEESEATRVFSDDPIHQNEAKTCQGAHGTSYADRNQLVLVGMLDGKLSAMEVEDEGGQNTLKLVLVSTLDGKLSALEVEEEEGRLAWSVDADASPLLSSSISKLEISHEGVPTRYLPSLDGGLYKYDGESIEAVPMTADTLLSSSFKLADNTVMVGGKDKQTYGIDPQTGQVRYVCGSSGCDVSGEDVSKQEDVLVITRQTQTVRAVDSRAGSEKWNFSVGQHELKYIKGQHKVITEEGLGEEGDEEACVHTYSPDGEDNVVDLDTFSNSLKIVVPEGVVVGVDPVNLQMVNWQYKFKSPISGVWLLYQGQLLRINMFSNTNIPALSSFEPEEQPLSTPLLYVGMHNHQLYVQPSVKLQEKVAELAKRRPRKNVPANFDNIPRVAWKPYLNTAQWRTPIMNNEHPQISAEDRSKCPPGQDDQEQGLTIWHENYPFDNGFYLYPEFSVQVPFPEEEEPAAEGNQSGYYESILDEYIPVSLWNWWKEVVAISLLTSVIVHLVLTRVQRMHEKKMAEQSNTNNSASASTGSVPDPEQQQHLEVTAPGRQNSDEALNYVSRFEADFDMLEVLGKGGFGVVFETRNKVDDCHYAVKRITVPNNDGAKEKVMREVKALAKLDHIGIVRYFHAWVESPPLGWQEERDRELDESEMPNSITADIYPTTTRSPRRTPSSTPPKLSPIDQLSEAAELLKPSHSPKPKHSPLDFLQNPFGGQGFEFSEVDMKRGSSEEFTVNSKSDSFWDRDTSVENIDEEEEEDESGSFSCGMGTPNLEGFHIDDSVDIEFRLSDNEDESTDQNVNNNNFNNNKSNVSSSPKNIPFGNYDKSSNSGPSRQSSSISRTTENNDSIQIVFEDSGCAENNKSSKESSSDIYIGIPSTSSDLISSSSKLSTSKSSAKSHSRTPSKDLALAKLTIEKEGKNKSVSGAGEVPVDGEAKILTPASRKATGEVKPKLFLYIQMQLCKRETLKDWLSSNTLNRDRHTVLDMFDQITCAIEYVHDCGLMHRDLKPSNIFFSLDGVIKMGDFGLVQTAFPMEQSEEVFYGSSTGNPYKKHTAQVGTTMYMSPEQMSGKVYSQKVDVFSLGLILFEMLYPFATNMERVNTLLKVKQQTFPERFCREMENEYKFVKQLVSHNPDDRPMAKEILSSQLLKEFESRRMPRRFRTRTVSQNSS